jgi:hypothetical protein
MQHFRSTLILGCFCFVTFAAAAQDKPKGDDILDNFVKVTGGKEAYAKIKSIVVNGKLEFTGQGLKGNLAVYQSAPNKFYEVVEIPMVEKQERGYDGKTAWEKSLTGGGRILTGEEKAVLVRGATVDADVKWRDFYTKAEFLGEEDVQGKPTYKVELTSKEGTKSTHFYDKSSGLLIKSIDLINSPMGKVKTESFVGDYKKVEGILFPHAVKQTALGREIAVTLDKIQVNVEVPKDRFDLPDEIKKLAEKK